MFKQFSSMRVWSLFLSSLEFFQTITECIKYSLAAIIYEKYTHFKPTKLWCDNCSKETILFLPFASRNTLKLEPEVVNRGNRFTWWLAIFSNSSHFQLNYMKGSRKFHLPLLFHFFFTRRNAMFTIASDLDLEKRRIVSITSEWEWIF